MRLIDADRLLKGKKDHELISTHLIWNAPTVDAVEVVRCKDCRHSFTGNYFKGYACKRLSGEHTFTVSPDGFCSKGERRE